jgi:hypothetical protein
VNPRFELNGCTRVASPQPRCNLVVCRIERELLPLALEQGLKYV